MGKYSENIFKYIRQQQIRLVGFCYFVINDKGIVEFLGSDTEHFAGRTVDAGEQITDIFPLLTGCFPLLDSPIIMPHIELGTRIFADVHLYKQEDKTFVLFVDSTQNVSKLLQTIQKHNEQILLNEKSELYHNSVIATEIMNIFELAVFEQVEDGWFIPLFDAPDWLKQISDKQDFQKNKQIEITTLFPFLEMFLEQATEYWKNPTEKRIASELWTEMDAWGNEHFLRAYAGKLINANILIIGSADVNIKEKKDLIQKAREKSLDFERLEKTEQALQKLLKFKERFVSIVSHDLRGPLSNMAFHSDYMLKKMDIKDEKIRKFLTAMNKELNRVMEYNDKIYHWSNLELGNFTISKQKVKLHNLLEEIRSSFENKCAEKQIEISVHSEPNHQIYADESLFIQVVNNLVSNAIKFTPENGSIVLKTLRYDDEILLKIIDNGIGIRKKLIPELFKEFNPEHKDGTSGEKGSGLGLGIAKRILDGHGFTIKVDSIPNSGTTFTITIPLAQ